MQLEKRRQPMKISTHECLNQQHEIHYIRIIPVSASLGFLIRGFKTEDENLFCAGKTYKRFLSLTTIFNIKYAIEIIFRR